MDPAEKPGEVVHDGLVEQGGGEFQPLQRHRLPAGAEQAGAGLGEVGEDQAGPGEGGGVDDDEPVAAGPVGEGGADQVDDGLGGLLGLGDAGGDLLGGLVGSATGDGVVPAAGDEAAPGRVQEQPRG